jgi:hypothetical protein
MHEALPYDQWKDSLETLHRWMQVIGKVKLELAPFLNHWWEVSFFVTANGMTTGLIPYGSEAFQMDMNFIDHSLSITTSWNQTAKLKLKPQSVAAFYNEFFEALTSLRIKAPIWPVPVEIQDPIPFKKDTVHNSYDELCVERWWRILLESTSVFNQFRSGFRGKSSPTQFFWGSFDLCGARFSGNKATPPDITGPMGNIMRFSENEENFTYGFWPGDNRFPDPAYFSYIYPQPENLQSVRLEKDAYFNQQLGEFILPYESVRKAKSPDQKLLRFLETTYQASATRAGWDIASLKNDTPNH